MACRAAATPIGRTLRCASRIVAPAAVAAGPAAAAARAAIGVGRRRQTLLRRSLQPPHPHPHPHPLQPQLHLGGALPSRSQLLRSGPALLGGGSLLATSLVAGFNQLVAASMSAKAAAASESSSPSGAIVVYVTVPSAEVGESLGSKLVEARLAACVNMLPGVTSIYSWKGKIEKDPELLLIIKTRQELLPELTTFVRANHPYEEPEVIGLPILGGSPSYLQWLMDNTGPAPKETEQPRSE